MRFSKKLIGVLACTSALAGVSVAASVDSHSSRAVVQAATNYAPSRSYGVDVSSFQSTNLSAHAQAGAQFAIVKVSEGTSYRNPNAAGQISSAKANNMLPMAYHFAIFGSNASAAQAEARYAVSSAQAYGLPKGSYIVCDWETGDGNNVNGGVTASTNAILSFMNTVKASGYQPMLYSGAYLLRNNINTSSILAKYPNSLWVASYATMGRIDTPDFNYFPSMDGIAIWQFTDNWRGLYVDGNISLLPLSYNSSSSQAPATTPTNTVQVGTSNSGSPLAKVASSSSISVYSSPNGSRTGKTLSSGTSWKVFSKQQVNGVWWYNVGGNQWVNGNSLYVTGFSSIPVKATSPSNNTQTGTSNSESPLAKVTSSSSISVYSSPNGSRTGKTLSSGTSWKVFSKQQVNGVWWYNVGGNQWVNGNSLYVTGFSSIPVVNSTSNNSSLNNTSSNSNATSGVGHINYVPGYGINLWIGYGSDAQWSGRRLPHGTSWRFYKKVTVNGKTWYNLGGNQWIDGTYFVVD